MSTSSDPLGGIVGKSKFDGANAERDGVEAPQETEEAVSSDQVDTAGFENMQVDRESANKDVPSVVYTGVAGTMSITKDQWEQAGITDQEGVVWDSSNGFTIPLDRLSDNAVARLRSEPGFRVNN
jgi:hypothetical protein